MIDPFGGLEARPQWVAWREEVRGSARALPTKPPYDPNVTGPSFGWGNSTDPATWGTHAQAKERARQLDDGRKVGCGFVLGDLGDNTYLAGADLDSSLDENGALALWAVHIISVLQTYAEISPSGHGLKAFFRIPAELVRWFLDRIGVEPDAWGCKRGIPGLDGANHGPGVEIYASSRYFTVTGQSWSIDHPDIVTLDRDQLAALATLIPPLPGHTASVGGTGNGTATGTKAGARPPRNSRDNSRSARAARIAIALMPDSYDDMVDGLRNHAGDDIRAWIGDKGETHNERELKRIWGRIVAQRTEARQAGIADLEARTGNGVDPDTSAAGAEPYSAQPTDDHPTLRPTPPTPPLSEVSDGPADDDFPGDRATQAQHHWGNSGDLSFRDPWNDPMSPEWPCDVLPTRLHDMLFEISLRDGLDPASQGMSLLTAASGAAPKSARFFPYIRSQWWVPPIIWTMIIALSGQRKTALLTNAFAALHERHAQLWEAYMTALADWRADPEAKNSDRPEEPHSYVVNDTSPEKVQHILSKSKRGTLLLYDELARFFDFGRYNRGHGAAERSFYLESYEGGPYTVHRLSRDSLYIAVNGLTVYGHIQPDRLKDFAGLEDDGLLQRIITIRGGAAGPGRDLDVKGQDAYDMIITALANLRDGLRYRTTPDGGGIIRQMERDGSEYAAITDYGVGFQGFCGKLHGTLARVSLILHLIDDPADKYARIIPVSTIERADRLVRRFILPHAVDFYAGLTPDRLERTRAIAGWLLTSSPVRLRASDFGKHVRACRGLSLALLNEALDPLVTGGWLIPKEPFPSNREWKLKIEVREAMAHRVAAAAARREEVRQLWERIASERRAPSGDAQDG